MSPVSSFDVFDTCLTRTFAYPVDLFLELGEISAKNGWTTLTPKEFMACRIAAENTARQLSASGEIVFADIYRQLAAELKLDVEIASKIQNMELEVEDASIRPILETRYRVAHERQQGRQILFLSNMYQPVSFIEGLLRKHEFLQDGDVLHVSGEIGLSKRDGALFEYARELLKNNFADWIHVGDHPQSDVEAPRQLGITAEHFEPGLLNRYELEICPAIRLRHVIKSRFMAFARLDRFSRGNSQSHVREKWQSRLGAAMRIARLSKPGGMSPRQKVFWDTGANVIGPLFYKDINSLHPELASESSMALKMQDALSVLDREILQSGILAFSKSYAAIDDGNGKPENYISAVLSLWRFFRENPTSAEADAWGIVAKKK
jgi:FMN phosphatase YigB (HAD superfamily)